MPRVKEVLELVKRGYAQAKTAPPSATKKAASPTGHKHEPGHKGGRSDGVEIIRAVFPKKG